MILLGLMLGWWWRTALVAAAALWPVLLWRSGVYDQLTEPGTSVSGGWWGLTLGAAGIAALNAGLGVGVDQTLLAVARGVRRRHGRSPGPQRPVEPWSSR
jgi:hypothetical protein